MKTTAKAMGTIGALVALTLAAPAGEAATYGCFKVQTDINIRARPYSSADVIGAAAKGDMLEKRKLLCTLRGYWCAVRTKGGLEGYADKSFLEKAPCPK